MKKNLGIFLILVGICLITAVLDPKFLGSYNLQNTIRWSGIYGIMAIGVSFVIITGGIDMTIGSVVGLIGCLLPLLLAKYNMNLYLAVPVVLILSLFIGWFNGILVTKGHLQPFVVTLCGWLFYRGIIRYVADDVTQGFGSTCQGMKDFLKSNVLTYFTGHTFEYDIPMVFVLMLIIAAVFAFFLNRTIWGRYLLALGRNEQAAKFSGIQTDRIIILAYTLSALLAGVTGIILVANVNSADPSGFGQSYELYAIAGAVLGGCSLKGGEGSILGVIIGSAILRVLYNSINILGIPTQLEFAVIGVVILIGVIADEIVRRVAAKRAAMARVKSA
jgi:ribose transport system permease protein